MRLKHLRVLHQTVAKKYSHNSATTKNFFITTPIFYVNASPHMGHLYSAVVADAVHRFQKLIGCEQSVFSTGTDEHGIKIQHAAAKNGSPDILQYCTKISEQYKSLFKQYNVEFTDYIRTTEDRHHVAVDHFWNCLESKGHIYVGTYCGWYSVQDETFLSENQVKEVKDPTGNTIKVSAESGHPVEWSEEKNYLFKLSSFSNDLLHWLTDGQKVWPDKFNKILLDWINNGAVDQDISVSRPTSRVHWGIPIPSDPKQTVYVWLDALINYLTVIGYPDPVYEKYWPCKVHVVGKDILKFHGLYWPAFLLAAGLEPPQSLICHSHWTVDGEKMSKSLGNVVDPVECANKFTADGFRYFLLREGTMHSDANYSEEKAKKYLNAELANKLGNLLSRSCGKVINPNQVFPPFHENYIQFYQQTNARNIMEPLLELPDVVKQHYVDYNFYKAVDAIIYTIDCANKYFEDEKPWQLVKNPHEHVHLDSVLHLTMETLRACGILLQPIIPHISTQLLTRLGIPNNRRLWCHIQPFSWENNGERLSQAYPISDYETSLYKRIN